MTWKNYSITSTEHIGLTHMQPLSVIAQLGEHCTDNAKVVCFNPVQSLKIVSGHYIHMTAFTSVIMSTFNCYSWTSITNLNFDQSLLSYFTTHKLIFLFSTFSRQCLCFHGIFLVTAANIHNISHSQRSPTEKILTAFIVLTSQTLIVPSNDAVANKSGLSGLNLQSNIVSTCPWYLSN